MKIARRLAGISASPTMAVMQEAQRLKKEGVDIIDFGPGEPDFPTPAEIKEAAISAIIHDFTKYTASSGIPELREAVADRLNRLWDTRFTPANVVITCGAKHAIYNVCMAAFEEGDEVLVPAPYWVTFPEVVKITGATPRPILTPESDRFILQTEAVRANLGPHTRGLIVNTPNNPTGAVIGGETVEQLARLGREKELLLLFDETYDYFTYGEQSHVSLAKFIQESDEFYAIVGSVSKTYSMTGWRIGYLVAPKELAGKIGEYQSHQTSNPASISQKAALAAFQGDLQAVQAMKDEYEKRRAFVLKEIAEIPGFSCVVPDGAFYVFPNVSDCLRVLGMAGSDEFARFLIQQARVATVPGSAFGLEGYIRISYATSMENLQEGLSRMRQAVTSRFEKAGAL